MSDSRRRSSRSSSTSHHRTSDRTSGSSSANRSSSDTASIVSSSSSSSRHRSSRHSSSGTSSSAPSNRSSTSLHRISGSSSNRSRESLVAPPSTPATHSSSRKSGSSSLQPPATDSGPSNAGGIYGNLGGHASESRFSLTDQFASTRSVLDFGFDDSASSIFDAQSIFSVGTARAPSLYGYDGYEAAAAAAAAASAGGGGLDPFPELGLGSMTPTASSTGGGLQGSPWQAEEEYLGGAYSTVLEENEDDDTATIGGRDDGLGGGDDNDLTDDNDTPEQTPTKPKRSRAPSSADLTVVGGGGSQRSPPRDTQILEELQDPLRLPVPVLPPSQRGPRPSYGAAPPSYATAAPRARIPVAPVHRTYYDLFCLSREQFPPPSGAQIRAAYYRLFRLLNSSISNGSGAPSSSSNLNKTNLMPTALRPFAAAYFLEFQNAFETLIDPIRRLEYDRYLDDLEDDRAGDDSLADDSESEVDDGKGGDTKKAEKASTAGTASYPLPQGPAFVRKYDFQTTTDLGARYTVSGGRLAGQLLPSKPNVTSLDYSLTQSVRVGLPTLRQYTEAGLFQLQRRIQWARRLLHERYGIGSGGASQSSFKSRDGRTYYYTRRQSSSSAAAADQPLWPIRCGIPIVSLSASTYSLSTAAAAAGAVLPLGDRYQPLLPEVLGPTRIAQLAHTRASGCVVLGYHQEFWTGSALANPPGPSLGPPPPSVVAEVETEVLPRVAVTARVAQTLKLPAAVQKLEHTVFGRHSDEPVHVEAMVQTGESSLFSSLPPSSPSLPRFGLGLSRRVANGNGGNIFLCADSGNAWWSPSSSSAAAASPFTPIIPPMVEVGYSMSPHELGLHAGRPLTGPADRGLKGVDIDMDTLGSVTTYATDRRNPVPPHGTWTISAATTGYGSVAAYLRYGRTVFLTPLWRSPPATAAANSRRGRRQRQSPQRAVRVEAELCAADRFFSDGYLAVRALAPVRWWGLRTGWTSNATASFRSSTPASTTPPKLGLEVALSAGSGNVHVSLYWSRLGQRIKLPFLLLPNPAATHTTATKLFVWAAIVPMAAMAVREVARVYWRAAAKQWKTSRSKARAKKRGLTGAAAAADSDTEGTGEADFVFDEEEEQAITRHRAEADELTMILASAVDAQRVLERQMRQRSDSSRGDGYDDDGHRRNELVIISAKYGVALADDPDDLDGGHARHDSATSGLGHGISTASPPVTAMASRNGWAPDYEVADVTAAVSALIVTGGSGTDATDSDYLYIPAGLQKGRLLGFWDPAPSYRTKQQQQSDEPSSAAQRRARGKKVLHVRYLWNGHERVAEVGDRVELRLP